MSTDREKVQVVLIWKSVRDGNSLLLLKTNQDRGGFWQNVTGTVDLGEDVLGGAERELREETGIKAEHTINLHHVDIFTDQYGNNCREHLFLVLIKQEQIPLVYISGEHCEYVFKSIDSVKQNDFGYNSNYEAFKLALSHIERLEE